MGISIRKNLKLDIHFARAFALNFTSLTQNADMKYINGISRTAQNGGNIAATTPSQDLHTNFIASRVEFIKGCGTVRARLNKFVNADGATPAGVVVGLLKNTDTNRALLANPTAALDETALDFAIMTNRDNLNASVYQFNLGAGAFTDSTVSPHKTDNTGVSNNDIIDLALEEGKIKAIVRTSAAGGTTHTLGTFDLTLEQQKEGYFPIVGVFGDSDTTRIGLCMASLDPFKMGSFTPPTYDDALIDDLGPDHGTVGAGATPRPTPSKVATVSNIVFGSLEVANFLGFDAVNLNPLAVANVGAVFTGDNSFSSNLGTNTYLIELLNLQINSYHGLANGRKNILAAVPVSDVATNENGVIQYEPNNYTFIDLNNRFESTIRNIRARIIGNDFSSIETNGLAELSILIKDKDE